MLLNSLSSLLTLDCRRSDRLAAAPKPPIQKHFRIDLRYNKRKFIEARDTSDLDATPPPNNDDDDTTPPTSIRNLSLECLQLILLHATPDALTCRAKTYQEALYGLVLVCRTWRDAAVRTPSLWSHLTNGITARMLEACLHRSAGSLVTVHFDGAVEYPINVQTSFDRFVTKVIARSPDWKSLRLTNLPPTWHSVLTVDQALNCAVPKLTSITVTTIYDTTIPRLHRLRFDTPRLRHVFVNGLIPDLSTCANLQTLSLRRPKGVSAAPLVVLLARNSTLLRLELEDVRVLSGHLFREPETFEMSELVHFKLHLLEVNTAETAQVFTRLREPKCKTLDLSIDMN
ncbi:hypothetical protein FRB90_002268 [Tulasnella sp. 427]|nr:hypothetical protein FRB90_002268 [Tulasnella sp. 427]